MTKDNFDRKKNYGNDKIIKLDPLAKKLDSVGMTGGASKSSSIGFRYDKLLGRKIPVKMYKKRQLQKEKAKLEMNKIANQPTKSLSLKNIDIRLKQINIDLKKLSD